MEQQVRDGSTLSCEESSIPEIATPSTVQPAQPLTQDACLQFMGIECDDRWASLLTAEDMQLKTEILQTSGTWVVFEEPLAGFKIKVVESFVTGDAQFGIRMRPGSHGIVRRIDEDGDFQVLFPCLLEAEYTSFSKWLAMRWVLKQDVQKLRCLVLTETTNVI